MRFFVISSPYLSGGWEGLAVRESRYSCGYVSADPLLRTAVRLRVWLHNATEPSRSKFHRLLVGSPSGSFHHTPGLLYNKTKACYPLRVQVCNLNHLISKTSNGLFDSYDKPTTPADMPLLIFFCALPCALGYGSTTLPSRLAVNSTACSSALLHAHSTIPRVCFKAKATATTQADML